MDLNPGNFICTYSGDIVPLCLKKSSEYAFQFTYGPRASEEYEVCALRHWTLGNHFNHSNEKNNIVATRLLTINGVVIVISVGKEKVKAGEELKLCYNGNENGYNTEGYM